MQPLVSVKDVCVLKKSFFHNHNSHAYVFRIYVIISNILRVHVNHVPGIRHLVPNYLALLP